MLLAADYLWDEEIKEFRSPSGIVIQFLMAGTKAGKGSEVAVSEPAGELNIEQREGLSVVRLIAIRKLDSSFARFLHKSLRKTFKELVRSAHSDG